MNRFFNIIAVLIITTPLFPKLKLYNDFYIYFSEICLIPLFVYALCRPRLFFGNILQASLTLYWVAILIATCISNAIVIDIAGLLRVFKEILYIPLLYVGQRIFDSDKYLKRMVYFGTLAITCSTIFYFWGIMENGLSIWNEQFINSGFSNKYFDIVKIEFGRIPNGAHEIWGEYCVLIFGLLWVAFRKKMIGTFFFFYSIIMTCISLMSCVSRSASLVFAFTILSILINGFNLRILAINKKKLIFVGLFTFIIVGAFSFFAKSLPILIKYAYTIESIGKTGKELNIEQRKNVWYLTAVSFIQEPVNAFWGFGYNHKRYSEELKSAKEKIDKNLINPGVPESLFVQSAAYGGVFGIIIIIIFLFRAIQIFYKTNSEYNLLIFFISLVIVNAISSASMLADLLYGQLLLILGVLSHKCKIETYRQQNCIHKKG